MGNDGIAFDVFEAKNENVTTRFLQHDAIELLKQGRDIQWQTTTTGPFGHNHFGWMVDYDKKIIHIQMHFNESAKEILEDIIPTLNLHSDGNPFPYNVDLYSNQQTGAAIVKNEHIKFIKDVNLGPKEARFIINLVRVGKHASKDVMLNLAGLNLASRPTSLLNPFLIFKVVKNGIGEVVGANNAVEVEKAIDEAISKNKK